MALKTQTYAPKGFLRERVKSIPVTIVSTALDAGNTGETHVLRAGLVLGIVTASGKYVEYDDDGTDDGRRTAKAVLMHDVDLKDGDPAASAADHVADVLVLGSVYQSGLIGGDANGYADLESVGISCLDY